MKPKPSKSGKIWGLTGGVASGKSTVAAWLQSRGFPVLDADVLAKELSAPGGRASSQILHTFGTLDRAELRKKIFQNPSLRKTLEGILHPLIVEESKERLHALLAQQIAQGKPAHVFYEASLLLETGRAKDFDELLVVHAPREVRKARLLSRDAISEALAEQMLLAQVSEEARLQAATYVLKNEGSREELEEELRKFLQIIDVH